MQQPVEPGSSADPSSLPWLEETPTVSVLIPFPFAESLSDFIISPPRALCVVYMALVPAAGLALSVFFPLLLVRW